MPAASSLCIFLPFNEVSLCFCVPKPDTYSLIVYFCWIHWFKMILLAYSQSPESSLSRQLSCFIHSFSKGRLYLSVDTGVSYSKKQAWVDSGIKAEILSAISAARKEEELRRRSSWKKKRTMPNWLSFLTSQGRMAVDPMCAFTVVAFRVRNTHSSATCVSCPKVISLLTEPDERLPSFRFSWMAWLGDHSWRRCLVWWRWWLLWCFWCLWCHVPSDPSVNKKKAFRKQPLAYMHKSPKFFKTNEPSLKNHTT